VTVVIEKDRRYSENWAREVLYDRSDDGRRSLFARKALTNCSKERACDSLDDTAIGDEIR
jgi:hypothetical protein